MYISLDIRQMERGDGSVACVDARVRIEHSPREGFDNAKLGMLERDLAALLTHRLNDALTDGDAVKAHAHSMGGEA